MVAILRALARASRTDSDVDGLKTVVIFCGGRAVGVAAVRDRRVWFERRSLLTEFRGYLRCNPLRAHGPGV